MLKNQYKRRKAYQLTVDIHADWDLKQICCLNRKMSRIPWTLVDLDIIRKADSRGFRYGSTLYHRLEKEENATMQSKEDAYEARGALKSYEGSVFHLPDAGHRDFAIFQDRTR